MSKSRRIVRGVLAALLCTVATSMSNAADASASAGFTVNGRSFASWQEYVHSDYFRDHGMRCGTPSRLDTFALAEARGGQSDCTLSSTTISASYDPGDILQIPVVVHIIRAANGVTGELSDALVQSQIEILNEDFLALAATNGANGTYGAIQFVLASTDPGGSPTTGITRSDNAAWFNDDETAFKNALLWDTTRYLNIYTNNNPYLGYAYLPQSAAGQWWDGVVIHYLSFGRNAPGGPPYDQGRTATHEVGDYLGLEHTFAPESPDACPSGTPDCYSDNGDLLCDTEPEFQSLFGCPVNPTSCGTPDPYTNYMDYTDDLCMAEFTPEQVNRMRCSIINYRPSLFTVIPADLIFNDDFESSNTTQWSSSVP